MSGAQPFSPRAVLGLVVAGAVSFLVLLYAIGQGLTGEGNDGGGHVLSKGLTGYAALAMLLEKRGFDVVRSRDAGRLDEPGLLVLTPPHQADVEELRAAIEARRRIGPTLIVLPKWLAIPARGEGVRPGWVVTGGTGSAELIGRFDEHLEPRIGRVARADFAPIGTAAALRRPSAVQSLAVKEEALLALVRGKDGAALIGYLNDNGVYPALDEWSGWGQPDEPDRELLPVVIVAEPDLLDNLGLADRATALNALALFRMLRREYPGPVIFDTTFNGLGRTRNMLTLAFTPPFAAATLALILAAFAAAWRAFARFGPPRLTARGIAFGKTALVESSAGLIRRTGRIRLLGAPYAALVLHRLARTLGLPVSATPEQIDAAQQRRGIAGAQYSRLSAALATARKPHDLVRAATALHALEKDLAR